MLLDLVGFFLQLSGYLLKFDFCREKSVDWSEGVNFLGVLEFGWLLWVGLRRECTLLETLPVNYWNFGIFQGFYIIYHESSSGPFGYFRLSQVSVIISGPLSGLITCTVGQKKYLVSHKLCKFSHLKKMRDACNFHHRYTSTMTDNMRKKNPENHIVGFVMNLFANYGGK
jgi:hypothetical protein